MSVKLTDLVGTHSVEAYWEGERWRYDHQICDAECEDHDSGCAGRQRSRRKIGVWPSIMAVVVLRMDGLNYRFMQEPLVSGDPRDRSSICGAIDALAQWPLNIWAVDQHFYHPPLVWEFRLHVSDDREVLYATSEETGECCFEIGTELDHNAYYETDMIFHLAFNASGLATPPWLVPDDGIKPVEIRVPRETVLKNTPGGKGREGRLSDYRASVERARRHRDRQRKAGRPL